MTNAHVLCTLYILYYDQCYMGKYRAICITKQVSVVQFIYLAIDQLLLHDQVPNLHLPVPPSTREDQVICEKMSR